MLNVNAYHVCIYIQQLAVKSRDIFPDVGSVRTRCAFSVPRRKVKNTM
jgi:hypothetical protein